MSMEFCSISSGSRGNCYVLRRDDLVLLIDAGISGKKIWEGLEKMGICPDQVDGVLVTHEHGDHVKGVKMVCRKSSRAYVYCNRPTWEQFAEESFADRHRVFVTDEPFTIRDIEILPFATSHDAVEPVGFAISCDGRKMAVMTDTGIITDRMYEHIKDADLLVLESNHEVNILKMCRYPYNTKMRILGEHGHLSNETAAECVASLVKEDDGRHRTVLLAHLSKENNTPEMARLAVENLLSEEGIYLPSKVELHVLTQDRQSYIFRV